jgi:YebC/PmpR family DNA-binding regulatory protein
MSGHSKWSTIKHKKALTDAARSKVYTKLANMITVAAREKGVDIDTNFSLRLAIQKARDANMPQANIERAVTRGAGGADGVTLQEITYEAFGPQGAAFLIFVICDNKNRTSQVVKSTLEKNGGRLGGSGSVVWQFEQKGLIRVERPEQSLEDLELALIDAGADDIVEQDNEILIYTTLKNLEQTKLNLQNLNINIISASPTFEPKTFVKITDEAVGKKLIQLAEKLEELDDVTEVATNFEIAE